MFNPSRKRAQKGTRQIVLESTFKPETVVSRKKKLDVKNFDYITTITIIVNCGQNYKAGG
jgi:hypothetical protein